MPKTRLEALSDGVIAILITLLVFDIKPPAGADWPALRSVAPMLLTYVLSFLFLGIYWNNHHHLLLAARRINGGAMWANLHLLFWLSLLPFTGHWLRTSEFAQLPVAVYGVVLLGAACAFMALQHALIRAAGDDTTLRALLGRDYKGKASLACYCLGIAAARWSASLAVGAYVVVALVWLIPDRRIESRIAQLPAK